MGFVKAIKVVHSSRPVEEAKQKLQGVVNPMYRSNMVAGEKEGCRQWLEDQHRLSPKKFYNTVFTECHGHHRKNEDVLLKINIYIYIHIIFHKFTISSDLYCRLQFRYS